MSNYTIKRIYDSASKEDGYRMLIDKLWPRGIKKEDAKLDEWNQTIAPSEELRKWFSHKEEHFNVFAESYSKELEVQSEEIQRIRNIAKKQKVCLLYGAKNTSANHAIVLKEVLEKL